MSKSSSSSACLSEVKSSGAVTLDSLMPGYIVGYILYQLGESLSTDRPRFNLAWMAQRSRLEGMRGISSPIGTLCRIRKRCRRRIFVEVAKFICLRHVAALMRAATRYGLRLQTREGGTLGLEAPIWGSCKKFMSSVPSQIWALKRFSEPIL